MPDFEPSDATTAAVFQQARIPCDGPFICTACGCLCDDLTLIRGNGRVVGILPPCPTAEAWLTGLHPLSPASSPGEIAGKPAGTIQLLDRAAELLSAARAPVILGLSRSTNQAVASAVALADSLGAAIDVGDSSDAGHTALQRAGRVSATLGEIKGRADLVLFWGADPVSSHPRHWERYSVEASGRFIPDGRRGRTVVVVDRERTATASRADHVFIVEVSRQFEVLWTLRAMLRGAALDGAHVRRATGCEPTELVRLVHLLKKARYGAFFAGSSLGLGGPAEATATLEAATGLVRDLNSSARFVMLSMGEPGNIPGVEAVLGWQTGFPSAVDFGPGAPASLPGVTSAADRLGRREADLALIVGALNPEGLEPAAVEALGRIPVVLIAAPGTGPFHPAELRLHSARPGIEEAGTVMRVDGAALPLRTIFDSPLPGERDWLDAILSRLSNLPAELTTGA